MAKRTILVIDENREVLNFCEMILSENFSVNGALSGEEGLQRAETEKPDLILLEPRLHGTDGFEMCKRLIENPSTRHIPIVILSHQHDEESIQKANQLGVVDFLSKPIIPSYFSKRIQTIMERYAGKVTRCGSCFKLMQKDWSFCPYDGTKL